MLGEEDTAVMTKKPQYTLTELLAEIDDPLLRSLAVSTHELHNVISRYASDHSVALANLSTVITAQGEQLRHAIDELQTAVTKQNARIVTLESEETPLQRRIVRWREDVDKELKAAFKLRIQVLTLAAVGGVVGGVVIQLVTTFFGGG